MARRIAMQVAPNDILTLDFLDRGLAGCKPQLAKIPEALNGLEKFLALLLVQLLGVVDFHATSPVRCLLEKPSWKQHRSRHDGPGQTTPARLVHTHDARSTLGGLAVMGP
ncbi:MAG: hypothetical protein VCA36_05725 [Opitutales bacterium]